MSDAWGEEEEEEQIVFEFEWLVFRFVIFRFRFSIPFFPFPFNPFPPLPHYTFPFQLIFLPHSINSFLIFPAFSSSSLFCVQLFFGLVSTHSFLRIDSTFFYLSSLRLIDISMRNFYVQNCYFHKKGRTIHTKK